MFKEIGVAQKVLGVLADLQKIDADGDGVADFQEYREAAIKAIPEVLSAQNNLKALQQDIADIQAILGDKFDLFMKDLALIQEKLEGKKKQ